MHAVSMPTHEYSCLACVCLDSPKDKTAQGPGVLWLRAQAEAEEEVIARLREEHGRMCGCQQQGRLEKRGGGSSSRSSSPSTSSSRQHERTCDSHKKAHARQGSSSTATSSASCTCCHLWPKFPSLLFRPNRAVLLRLFVPSPDGT